MGEKNTTVLSSTPFGITAEILPKEIPELSISPATVGAPAINKAVDAIKIVGCWKIESICFDFDSAFVEESLPTGGKTADVFAALSKLHTRLVELFKKNIRYASNPRPLLTIFGHADPVGGHDYNKYLSEKRARAVYCILTRDVSSWMQMFSNTDRWNKDSLSGLNDHLKALTLDPGSPHNPNDPKWNVAVNAYMEKLCTGFQLRQSDFLGNGNYAYQGCSDFNPLIVLSTADERKLRRVDRDTLNQPNRRMLVFMLLPGTVLRPTEWPCPKSPNYQVCQSWFIPTGQGLIAQGSQRKEIGGECLFACSHYRYNFGRAACEVKINVPLPQIRICVRDEEWTCLQNSNAYSRITKSIEIPDDGVMRLEEREFMTWTDGNGWFHEYGWPPDIFTVELSLIEHKKSIDAKEKDTVIIDGSWKLLMGIWDAELARSHPGLLHGTEMEKLRIAHEVLDDSDFLRRIGITHVVKLLVQEDRTDTSSIYTLTAAVYDIEDNSSPLFYAEVSSPYLTYHGGEETVSGGHVEHSGFLKSVKTTITRVKYDPGLSTDGLLRLCKDLHSQLCADNNSIGGRIRTIVRQKLEAETTRWASEMTAGS